MFGKGIAMASAAVSEDRRVAERRFFYRVLRPGEMATVSTLPDGKTVVVVAGPDIDDAEENVDTYS